MIFLLFVNDTRNINHVFSVELEQRFVIRDLGKKQWKQDAISQESLQGQWAGA
jgi:hypothetical protein